MRRPFIRFLVIGALLATIGGVALAIYRIYAIVSMGQTARKAYYVQCVAEMIIFHLDGNDGQWPRSWDDLKDDKAKCGNLGQTWTMDELKQNVSIDWEASAPNLKQAISKNGEPPFRAVWLTDGTGAHWSGQEPNQEILDYLRGERTTLKLLSGGVPQPINP